MRLLNLTPVLETKDVKRTIEFYVEVLGFKQAGVIPNKENPTWTTLYKDSVYIMFARRNEHSTIPRPLMSGSLYLYTDNVDQLWNELKDKAEIEYPIENFDYGMREFAIRDCNGYLLQIGQDLQKS
ncbi:MAG: VOC family protein [Acidobacteriota bacterium]|nr:VOC family protein [Acidobacteriota bacterium]